jgi:hypothetical protein
MMMMDDDDDASRYASVSPPVPSDSMSMSVSSSSSSSVSIPRTDSLKQTQIGFVPTGLKAVGIELEVCVSLIKFGESRNLERHKLDEDKIKRDKTYLSTELDKYELLTKQLKPTSQFYHLQPTLLKFVEGFKHRLPKPKNPKPGQRKQNKAN